MKPRKLVVVMVTSDRMMVRTAISALSDLQGTNLRLEVADALKFGRVEPTGDPVYREAVCRARHYLEGSRSRVRLTVLHARRINEAMDLLRELVEQETELPCELGPVYLDLTHAAPGSDEALLACSQLDVFFSGAREIGAEVRRTPYSAVVFTSEPADEGDVTWHPSEYIQRYLPSEQSQLQSEILLTFMDYFDISFSNRRIPADATQAMPNAMASELLRFMTDRAGSEWVLYYFTGSVVSSVIESLDQGARERGVLRIRGPSEHALACGAMANWQLFKRPFLIVVTSSMMDEFKGTLANLRETRAKGIILCAESPPEMWYPFQGTITPEEDMREVLSVRGLPNVFLEERERLADDLEEAFRQYESGNGPVVILATKQLLELKQMVETPIAYPGTQRVGPELETRENRDSLAEVMRLINHEKARVLWQCGQLDAEEQRAVCSIARKAGIALADSMVHPGSVPAYINGRRNPSFLGTLGLYGTSHRVIDYLHTDGRLNPASEQAVFFLKTKVPQGATPFPEARMRTQMRIVQVIDSADRVAPFTSIPVVADFKDFLSHVERQLDVDPDVLEYRLEAIGALPDAAPNISCLMPTRPMCPEFFLRGVGSVIEELIENHGFEFVGLFDVGRSGVAAISHISRTDPGFSGWYGRALMGDALLATMSVAMATPKDVIAFIGDGARALVPDFVPSLLENLEADPQRRDRTVTVFCLVNGSLSMIETYQHRLQRIPHRQMRVPSMLPDSSGRQINGIYVHRATVSTLDKDQLRRALLQRGRLNLFSVRVGHNNEGVGLPLHWNLNGWQRAVPVPQSASRRLASVGGSAADEIVIARAPERIVEAVPAGVAVQEEK